MSGHWDFGDELELTEEQRATVHERVHAGPEFRALRRRMRGFAFPMAAAFLLWYLAFVLAASYARDLMATPVLGSINVGLLFGLAQFATTFALTAAYVRFARRRLDPLAEEIRAEVEGHPEGATLPRPEPVEPPRITVIHGVVQLAPDAVRVGSAR